MAPKRNVGDLAEASSGRDQSQSAPGTAQNTEGSQTGTGAERAPSRGRRPGSRLPDPEESLTRNAFLTGMATGHASAVLYVIREFLAQQGVTDLPTDFNSLFPEGWKVGNTAVPIRRSGQDLPWLRDALPHLQGFDSAGNEVHWIDGGRDMSSVVRLTANWDSPVSIVSCILSDIKNVSVKVDDVLGIAQRSPQALEKLKASGKEFKAHLQRFLDPVALRRSPEFNRVSAEYKARLRTLIDAQQKAIMAARQATAAVNKCLGERDDALSSLDPGYVAKRATARNALAAYGIDLGEDVEMADAEETAAQALQDLDF
uniref:Uncharacterized protein n=1 Tax=Colletotrichum gloeosporioides RNA virus 1 TaxID=2603565 RepID=A0A5B9BHH8_9VIRU|nr:hypothetical protein [Colletotrichum gloeosporioides RNA virus 1]